MDELVEEEEVTMTDEYVREDPREVVAVIPPGCTLEHVQELMKMLAVCCPGKELSMSNQTDGSIAIYYWTDGMHTDEAGHFTTASDIVGEDTEPNGGVELGDDDGPVFGYSFTEPDEIIKMFAGNIQTVLDAYDAANYVTTTLIAADGQRYAMTLQRVGEGFDTPAEKIARLEAGGAQARELIAELAPAEPINQDEQGGCVWCHGCPPGSGYGYATADPEDHDGECPWLFARRTLLGVTGPDDERSETL